MERYTYRPEEAYSRPNETKDQVEPLETEQGIGQVEKEAANKWVDNGIQNVPVEKVNTSDSRVKGPENFEKVSYEEMKRGTEIMTNFIRPNVEQGWTAENFRAYDQAKGLDYRGSTLRIYDAYYGRNPISVCKIGDSYTIANGGYHRMFVAKEMRVDTVPARVYELK
jgi:hypothetical protein